ncbi:monofunctional biosynthetic peptidoglycan transglycosylase [Phytohalomonas tamaricis]|uniref:monofunctional biosynthetic peptidoglycan transglycosylase n=1 Tax=Phytohalomonas tamaricis TaxID=2081032 RepID=UPI0021D4745F|nr:monofunctional biosynthetic peptidoglycan transglycosylase [Phytohalomonas tamaricis]
MQRLWRALGVALGLFVGVSVLAVVLFRFVPLPWSSVMLERQIESWRDGEPLQLQYVWVPYERMSSQAKIAVIASEDQRFPFHHGFDTHQIQLAFDAWLEGKSLRGASTISQQTAKNAFLWSGRSWVRKGLEAWFTGLIELIWPKQRILEVYLNIAEWDHGVFGLQAAARHYYGVDAGRLSAEQAARLAAVLPNPLGWSPVRPTPRVAGRARWIRQQMRQLGGPDYLRHLK